ncbi:MAG: hypothetical protein M1G31_07905 [Pseudanabaena sp. Salubria-1]|nr:hypothetical protein [Pseudanabaena sp. Salubria-1]MCX5936475.1 hypothetical protein [Pseudanabaena sp. LacPavin_0818_WC45_MAG_42_6]
MVEPLPPMQQTDVEMQAVPKELARSIQEIISLYKKHNKQNIIQSLENLISTVKRGTDKPFLTDLSLGSDQNNLETENEEEFLKSWDDIFNVQVYIDTEIFGELDPRPPALVELDNSNDNETIIQHTDATEIYVQAWKELAQSMSSFPDDLFTRLWTTAEIAKILECSPSSLRRSRRTGRLPIKVKDLILDCISHDGKRSLWFVRPS